MLAPEKISAASVSVRAPKTRNPCTRAPSAAFASGTIIAWNPSLRASRPMGSTPRTGKTSPESASSPVKSGGRSGRVSRPAATRMPRAMGKSKAAPSLRRSLGARFTVIFFCGSTYPLLRKAVSTRVRASVQA